MVGLQQNEIHRIVQFVGQQLIMGQAIQHVAQKRLVLPGLVVGYNLGRSPGGYQDMCVGPESQQHECHQQPHVQLHRLGPEKMLVGRKTGA
ncbi:MAG TPA: hypothetical protein DEO67_01530 [Candidatus Edwardsbacteria bacterium]|nr:hypothetical protein [Candidatus Edwardsbacteria bacterium]